MTAKILAVEDDVRMLKGLTYELKKKGFSVISTRMGKEAVELAIKKQPDLILLDLGLPDIDGFEVCKLLKKDERTSTILIIMLTARSLKDEIVRGLHEYADDYIIKPYESEILFARIEAVLRRKLKLSPGSAGHIITKDELTINTDTFEVFVHEEEIKLTKTEFHILVFLARRPNRVFSRQQILDNIWGNDVFITDRAVDTQITNLRKKLGTAKNYLESIYGVGYKFRG